MRAVGMAGLTLGGGYCPLIGRFGLALDNLLAAQVVLADGRTLVASRDNEEELSPGRGRIGSYPGSGLTLQSGCPAGSAFQNMILSK